MLTPTQLLIWIVWQLTERFCLPFYISYTKIQHLLFWGNVWYMSWFGALVCAPYTYIYSLVVKPTPLSVLTLCILLMVWNNTHANKVIHPLNERDECQSNTFVYSNYTIMVSTEIKLWRLSSLEHFVSDPLFTVPPQPWYLLI